MKCFRGWIYWQSLKLHRKQELRKEGTMAFQSSRIERMRKAMQEHDLDVLYIRELSNIIWATGFEDVFDTEDAHALIVSARFSRFAQ